MLYLLQKDEGFGVATNNHENTSKRRLDLPKRRWYNPRTWRRNLPLPPRNKLSSTTRLLRQTYHTLSKDWATFFGITFVYAVGVFIFVKSFSVGSVVSTGTTTGVLSAVERFGAMLSSASSSFNAASGIYQIIVSTICALALIWYLRQILSGEKSSAKQSFYRGMRPLVPYLLVLAMIGIQLLPLAIGGYLIGVLQSSSILYGWEMLVAWSIFILLAVWSLRMLTQSIFALFAVTLPDMTPLAALRGAKNMVYRRRLTIWRKIIVAGIIVSVVGLIVLLPFILWWPAAAPWVFFAFTVLMAMSGQTFLYTIYREIL